MNKQLTLLKSVITGFSAITLSMLAFSAQANLITNGGFETTIERFNPPFPINNSNGAGMLVTSANFTGPATTFLTLPGWQTTQDGIGCVVFSNTYVNGVCGSQPSRFGRSAPTLAGAASPRRWQDPDPRN